MIMPEDCPNGDEVDVSELILQVLGMH